MLELCRGTKEAIRYVTALTGRQYHRRLTRERIINLCDFEIVIRLIDRRDYLLGRNRSIDTVSRCAIRVLFPKDDLRDRLAASRAFEIHSGDIKVIRRCDIAVISHDCRRVDPCNRRRLVSASRYNRGILEQWILE